jgi:hypothetical protein
LSIFDCQGIPYCVLKGPVNFKWFACDRSFWRITGVAAMLRGPPPRGRARDIAINESFGRMVGEVLEMSMQPGGRSAHRAHRAEPGMPPIERALDDCARVQRRIRARSETGTAFTAGSRSIHG